MQVSIWEKETFYAPQDVIIIGGGFVGLWSAFYLKKLKPAARITLVERGLIPTGASSRNAGFACFGSLSEVVADAQAMGTDKMMELVEMRFRGLERIRKHFGNHAIDFDLCGGYELYDDSDQTVSAEIQHNIEYINTLFRTITGSKKTYRLADTYIDSFGFGKTKHLVKNQLEGYLHSGKLLQALSQTIQSMGVQVFNSLEIERYARINDHFELETQPHLPATPEGRPLRLSARQLLLCTNAFTKNLFPGIDIIPARGQVLLTSAIRDLPWKGSFHSDEGFYYFRNLDNRVLLGGARNKAFGDEETTEINTSVFIQEELERYLNEVVLPRYAGHYVVEHRWAGIMAMGSEKLPIVKELEDGVFCAVRMSGMGVALAPVVSQQIARMMKKNL